MPRGRHRHSPPLHRLLPPSAIAGVSVVCALGPWVFSEAAVLRVVAGAGAVTAVLGAFVMRRWDIQAGKQVAELTRARASDEWRHEERVAELETDLEESRELRAKLEQRLRAKRTELAGLRNEHAALLRRYATAETERASALEGRRRLELEAAAPSRELLPAARKDEDAAYAAVATDAAGTDDEPTAPAVFSREGARLFQAANTALVRLAKDASGDTAKGASQDTGTDAPAPDAAREDEAEGKPGAADGREHAAAASESAADRADDGAETPSGHRSGGHFTVPTAVAVVPPAPPVRRPTAEGGFDFFGTKTSPTPDALEAVQNEDLADVVGAEALALHKAEAEAAAFKPADAEAPRAGQVIDLTAHDETEQINIENLRTAAS
ncbi:hypothetical protein ACFWII_20990 [Streptomyces sp. NPDC127063]|uniref:hypothetical protein n=1 Tax=Streptomyces sp. NPDC127063 TaxID=3347123 RepID=UPI00365607A8